MLTIPVITTRAVHRPAALMVFLEMTTFLVGPYVLRR